MNWRLLAKFVGVLIAVRFIFGLILGYTMGTGTISWTPLSQNLTFIVIQAGVFVFLASSLPTNRTIQAVFVLVIAEAVSWSLTWILRSTLLPDYPETAPALLFANLAYGAIAIVLGVTSVEALNLMRRRGCP